MTSEQFLFCCYNRSANFFSGHVPCKFFFYSNFFFGRRGGGGFFWVLYFTSALINNNISAVYCWCGIWGEGGMLKRRGIFW